MDAPARVMTLPGMRLLGTNIARHLTWSLMPLACILALQASAALITLHNTAFQDEALYLYAGRQIMTSLRGGPPVENPFASYLSGNPYFYPLLGSVFDAWGGVEAARLISLVTMMGTTVCVYWITNDLFGRTSAVFGSATFAFQGTVLFLSRLATYDASCLLLLAISTALAVRVGRARMPFGALGLGPLLILAALTKYAALLWLPSVLALLVWQVLQQRGWRQMVIRVGLTLVSLATSAYLALALLDGSFLQGLYSTTLNRQSGAASSAPSATLRIELTRQVMIFGGIELALGLLGLLLVHRHQRVLAFILAGSAFLAPAYHIYHGEPVSLYKHVAYALFFVAPLAGYALARMCNLMLDAGFSGRWLRGLVICGVILALGLQQAQWQFHQWSNSEGMTAALRTVVRPAGGHYFAEDIEVARYYLEDVTYEWQWIGPYYFQYKGKVSSIYSGLNTYQAAIRDGYFDAIEMSYGMATTLDSSTLQELQSGRHYKLVAKVFYQTGYGSGYYWVWRKSG